MGGKDKCHIPADLNIEAIFAVLSSIPSLQAFDPIVIAYFLEIVVIAFSNMKFKTHFINADFNGLKQLYPIAESNGCNKLTIEKI